MSAAVLTTFTGFPPSVELAHQVFFVSPEFFCGFALVTHGAHVETILGSACTADLQLFFYVPALNSFLQVGFTAQAANSILKGLMEMAGLADVRTINELNVKSSLLTAKTSAFGFFGRLIQ